MLGIPVYALLGVLAAFAWAAWRLICVWRKPDGEPARSAGMDADDVEVH